MHGKKIIHYIGTVQVDILIISSKNNLPSYN